MKSGTTNIPDFAALNPGYALLLLQSQPVPSFVSHDRGAVQRPALVKNNDLQAQTSRELPCKSLREREEKLQTQEQWETMEKQCEEQWKQSDMQARAYTGCGGRRALEKQTRPKR